MHAFFDLTENSHHTQQTSPKQFSAEMEWKEREEKRNNKYHDMTDKKK